MPFYSASKPAPSKDELLAMADASRDWEVLCTGKGQWRYMSPACERVTGYTREEFLEHPDLFSAIIHPDDKELVTAHCRKHSSQGREPSELVFRLITKTGETRWIWQTCQAALDKQGNWLGRRASNRDITQYKENEKRLERREHLLKEAQHVAGIGHWEIDLQTGVLSCSDQIYRIFDLEPRQANETFETFLAFVHPEDQDYLKRAHLNLLNKQKPYDLEFRLLLSNGLIKWVRSICSLEQSRDGNPLHALGTIHDITRLHDFDSVLRQERAMFMNGPVIVFIWQNNSNWPVEHISGNVLEILGYSTEEFLDGSILYSSLIHPEDLARVTNEVRANSSPESTHFIHQPYRLIARDGRIVWVLDSTTLVRDASGRISHYHGYLVDITHTIQIEEEVLAVKNRLEFIIDSANLGIWDWNIRTGAIVFNHRCAEMLGYRHDELKPNISTWLKLVDPEQKKGIIRALEDHLEGRTPMYSVEHRLRHQSGKWIWTLTSGKIWESDDNRNPLRAGGILFDISRRKEQELLALETTQLREQAKRIESLKTMAGAVAHRFNNSMLVVLLNLEMLCRKFPENSKEMEMASVALQAGKKASKIGKSMLTYLGHGIPRKQRQNLATIVKESLLAIIPTFPATIICEYIPPPSPIICGIDPIQMKHVFNNILTNAFESLPPETGRINITFGTAFHIPADFPILFREGLPERCRYGFCRITDNGYGIAPEDIERIFEPFFTTRFIGRGLGLPLAGGIMRTHQGAIIVESTLDKGTSISILLPAEE